MASTSYASGQWFNLMTSGAPRYLALFTTAPTDADAGAVEVSGGSYARVQIAGTVATSSATASGNTLTFSSVPAWIVAGMSVRDVTSAGAITSGTTVSAVGATTVTLSAAVAGAVSLGDTIAFSAFGPGTGSPATSTSTAAITFPQSTASWGTVTSWGIYDAATSGNLWVWDWVGNDPWFPCTITSATPALITAPGITAGSSPALANGAAVVLSARFGGAIASGLSAETGYTVAGLSGDTFNVGVATTGAGAAMVREVTAQAINTNAVVSFAAGSFVLASA